MLALGGYEITLVEGIKQTDHNVITATINTELEKTTKQTERWKKGKPEDWVKFNQEIHEKWRNTHTDKRNYTTLQNLITRSLKTTIGSTVISTNKREKITNPQIKEAKEKRREYKKQFEQACKERKDCKAELKNNYIDSQQNVKNLIRKQIQDTTKVKVNQIIKEEGANSKTFWNIRKQLINHNKNDEYDTKNEEGRKITDPEETKEHIANYFENLYQAREGEESHKQWTGLINAKVKSIDNKLQQKHTKNKPFSHEELSKCIKKLKRKKKHRT